jgi:RHS repeat-associated protein
VRVETGHQGGGGAGPFAGGADAPALPSVSLPKGGGAVRGLGEKFTSNPATGTGSVSIPIATSPARSGLGPVLRLGYDSGRGNGPFGLGWSIGLPAITRKTDKALPRYDDAGGADTFLLSDAEDLVPVLDPRSGWRPLILDEPFYAPGHIVARYRPRIDGLFARIERWTRKADGDVHWRSVTGDDVTTVYGADAGSRIADPADPGRVFSWLISDSSDRRGNAAVYEYKDEDDAGVDLTAPHERHRTSEARAANRYVKRIRYGNRTSRLVDPAAHDWMFEVVFDYGEHAGPEPGPAEDRPWFCRRDAFSRYKSGFEVRTYRLCQRVLLFHHFPDVPDVGTNCLVKSLAFGYASTRGVDDDVRVGSPVATLLASAVQSGHRRTGVGTVVRSLPPVEYTYTPATFHGAVADLDPESLADLVGGLAAPGAQYVDLDGEGLSGVLVDIAGQWYYKRNLGGGRLAGLEAVAAVPTLRGQAGGRPRFLDLAGDGSLDVVDFEGPAPGFSERSDHGWAPFEPFAALPRIAWDDPNLRFVDLDGDGHADVLLSDGEALTWYASLGERGFSAARRVPLPADETAGPRVVFSDATHAVHLADMSGDGLSDVVRVGNGEVCYWPNLGRGRFGAKVVMSRSPWLAAQDDFDPRNVQLADVDGSGVSDLVYAGRDGVRIWPNESGNGFAEPHVVAGLPAGASEGTTVTTADLLGNGTACLVWSSALPGDAGRQIRYVDLMGGVKPYLLDGVRDHLGTETTIRYASSTRFYLADLAAGRPWRTRLPFPVHVVERVDTRDRIGRNWFVSRYAYHHGHFDGVEREFRGFALVEQWDTEQLGVLLADRPDDVRNVDPVSAVPPVLTKTWYHTGSMLDASVSRGLADEYYREGDASEGLPGLPEDVAGALLVDDTVLPTSLLRADGSREPHALTPSERREAVRALKGSALRQEIYALDGSEAEDRPYRVTESNVTVEMLQPKEPNRHAVFLVHARESVTCDYERALYDVDLPVGTVARVADPRVGHDVTLDVDAYGNVLRRVSIAYPRRHPDPAEHLDAGTRAALHEEQGRTSVLVTTNSYTNAVDDAAYRTPLPAESRRHEVLLPTAAQSRPLVTTLLRFDAVRAAVEAAGDGSHDVPWEDADAVPGDEPRRRLVGHTRTLYRRDDLTAVLPLGRLESQALPRGTYTLALTPGLIAAVYRAGGEDLVPDPVALLRDEAHYTSGDEQRAAGQFPADDPDHLWWLPPGSVHYSADPADSPAQELAAAEAHFYLPRRFVDAYGNVSTCRYDAFDLLPVESSDPLGNRITVGTRHVDGSVDDDGPDYRVLQPRVVADVNRNRSAVAFDALGMVAGAALMGRPEESVGDSLDGFEPDLDQTVVDAQLADPLADPGAVLAAATTRYLHDLFAYARSESTPHPQPVVVAALSRTVHSSEAGPAGGHPEWTFAYSDGFGREIQHKKRAEPGPLVPGGPDARPRWVGTGWVVNSNKGQPVRRYEPFFSATHRFEFAREVGVSAVLFHDPLQRLVATLHPDGSYEKVTFDPWRQQTWDANDTGPDDPRDDPDVAALTAAYAATLPPGWRTWHQRRMDGDLGADEKDAADKVTAHAGTPGTAYVDVLGRPFLTVAHNRVGSGGGAADQFATSRVILDVTGNQRAVLDALGRTAVRRTFDLTSATLRVETLDGGTSWTVNNALGKAVRSWDSRGHTARRTYDALMRPERVYVRTAGGGERLRERTVYGESDPAGAAANLRGRFRLHFDGAGVVSNEEADFKGNVLRVTRRLASGLREETDWSGIDPVTDAELLTALPPDLFTAEVFSASTRFDALDRPTEVTSPDGTTARPTYNEAGLLEALDLQIRGAVDAAGTAVRAPVVAGVDYDAQGRRTVVRLGNGAQTEYTYDPLTARVTRVLTTRAGHPGDCPDPAATPCGVQHLRYTYDAVGNITRLADAAQPTVFFANAVVPSGADYTYDALYRLVAASGREHAGQQAAPGTSWNDAGRTRLPHPNDGQAMRRYTESYTYDLVGNLVELAHQAVAGSWTRTFELDRSGAGNRLASARTGTAVEPFTYDPHGNVTSMPHLAVMEWDENDRLRGADLGGGGHVHHSYDANGQRVRKAVEQHNGAVRDERIYLGPLEIHRVYSPATGEVTLERQTLAVLEGTRRAAVVETRTVGTDAGPARLVRYQCGDQVSSAVLELDDAADVISYEEYHPFGTTAFQSVRSQVEAPKRYRFAGKERDEETGLAYFGARYYAPWLARWTSVDPAGVADGLNVYAYVRNNPVNRSDPTGELSWGQWAGIGAAVVIGTALTVATAGLAGPVVGTAAAAIIGGIVGGAAGGAVGEAIEAHIDQREAHVVRAAVIGGAVGGIFSGAGAAGGALAKTAVGRAVATRVASSALAQGVKSLASRAAGSAAGQAASALGRRVANSAAGRLASGAGAALREPAERLGMRLSQRLGVGQGARLAADAQRRAVATQMAVQATEEVSRSVAASSEGQTFTHAVAWRDPGPLGPAVTGARVEAQSALRVTPGGSRGQWGEGAYAFEGALPESAPPGTFQFEVPQGTAVETIQRPAGAPIIRLVPPPGHEVVPIRITGTNFAPGELDAARTMLEGAGLPLEGAAPFRYLPPLVPATSPLTGGAGAGAGAAFGDPDGLRRDAARWD